MFHRPSALFKVGQLLRHQANVFLDMVGVWDHGPPKPEYRPSVIGQEPQHTVDGSEFYHTNHLGPKKPRISPSDFQIK